MKKQIRLILVLLTVSIVQIQAQEDDLKEHQFLFDSENIQISGFGGPLIGFSTLDNDFAVFTGGGGAMLINQKYFVGGYGEGLTTQHQINKSQVSCLDKNTIAFGYGGLWLGYIYKPHRLVHVNINTVAGWGGISLYDNEFDVANMEHCDKDIVFVVMPKIEMEVNLTSWMKFTAGAGYRFTSGISSPLYSQKMFNQPNIRLGVMFGNFSPNN